VTRRDEAGVGHRPRVGAGSTRRSSAASSRGACSAGAVSRIDRSDKGIIEGVQVHGRHRLGYRPRLGEAQLGVGGARTTEPDITLEGASSATCTVWRRGLSAKIVSTDRAARSSVCRSVRRSSRLRCVMSLFGVVAGTGMRRRRSRIYWRDGNPLANHSLPGPRERRPGRRRSPMGPLSEPSPLRTYRSFESRNAPRTPRATVPLAPLPLAG
jgi:hypothetical protein